MMPRRVAQAVITTVLVGTTFALPAGPAAAATLTVTKTADTNDGLCNSDCSLREAVVAAEGATGPDTIKVPAGTYRLDSGEGNLDITSEVTIRSVGGTAVIDGEGTDRVLEILETGDATLRGLRITGGVAERGGGINNLGVLTVVESTVDNNTATSFGGGINNESTGTLIVSNSTISGNTVSGTGSGGDRGGGISTIGTSRITGTTISGNSAVNGGGIMSWGPGTLVLESSLLTGNSSVLSGGAIFNFEADMTVTNSTLSGNLAGAVGGAILQSDSGELTTVNSTIVGNYADADGDGFGEGGGIYAEVAVTMRNSILADNVDAVGAGPDCMGPMTSTGFNIVGTTTGCEITLQVTDSTEVTKYGSLKDNGGPTRTHALPAGSAAIGHGPPDVLCSGTDQRGAPRGGTCDTGAYQRVLCEGALVNVVGTAAGERLKGTPKGDGVLALGGADQVDAGGGADGICGGSGNDKLFGEGGNDSLNGGPGKDSCIGGPGKDDQRSC